MSNLSSPSGLRVVEIDGNHAKGVAFNMLFMIWRLETTYEAMYQASRVVVELGDRCPEGVGVLQIVDVGSKPPDGRARAGIAEFLQTGAGIIKHSSVVHEGTGFGAAAVRAVMASLHMMHRPKFTHTTFSTLSEASVYHAKHQQSLGHKETAEAVLRAVRQLRAAIDSAVPA